MRLGDESVDSSEPMSPTQQRAVATELLRNPQRFFKRKLNKRGEQTAFLVLRSRLSDVGDDMAAEESPRVHYALDESEGPISETKRNLYVCCWSLT